MSKAKAPTFPGTLIALKEARGWTSYQLAKAAGLTLQGLRNIELGNKAPTLDSAVKLADALGVSLDALVGREVAPPKKS